MKSKLLEKQIDSLNLDERINQKLIANNIIYVKDLWILNRKKLKELDIPDKDINSIIVKLQLNGLDLNKKKY